VPANGCGIFMRSFRSDNNAGLAPEALEALVRANDGAHHGGYGDDPYTQRAVSAMRKIFGSDAEVAFTATGTAANVLAVAALSEPWQMVICHRSSHWNEDESTAPERVTHCRTVAVGRDPSRIVPEDLEDVLASQRGDEHQPQPGVVTISNPTEFGTLYRPDEVRVLASLAHANGFRLHVDGARFANAVAALGCDPRDLTVHAGVDALSFGGTKNGMAFGEAIVFFPQAGGEAGRDVARRAARVLPFHRKGTGHLLSKHRFVTAPFAAMLEDGAWLRHAAHANAMAQRLGRGLQAIGIEPAFPVEANGVFVRLPKQIDERLRARGHGYYPFGDRRIGLIRLMCSFDTSEADVDALLSDTADVVG